MNKVPWSIEVSVHNITVTVPSTPSHTIHYFLVLPSSQVWFPMSCMQYPFSHPMKCILWLSGIGFNWPVTQMVSILEKREEGITKWKKIKCKTKETQYNQHFLGNNSN